VIDVLEKWANVIGGSVNSRTTLADCIADLAAAVRTERARVAELERELAFADSDVAAKRSYIEELGCEMAVAKRLDSDQFEEIEGLRARVAGLETQLDRECVVCGKGARPGTVDMLNARVAELEADAKLGRMVREMPDRVELYKIKGIFHTDGWGDDPWIPYAAKLLAAMEAALEAARKGTEP